MHREVFSIYDSKAQLFADPMCFRTVAEALRAFEAESMNPKLDLCKYPADYTLFHIGHFDYDTGQLIALEHGKVSLGTVLEAQGRVEAARITHQRIVEAREAAADSGRALGTGGGDPETSLDATQSNGSEPSEQVDPYDSDS